MTDPKHHDWTQIIAELEAAGITAYKLSMMCYRTFNTVKHWKAGGQPKHYEGEMLLAIYAEYVTARTTAKICTTAKN